MFGNKEKTDLSVPEAPRKSVRSHVAAGMSVKGDVEGDIDLFLEGRIEGNLRCRSISVGRTGELIGKIVAQEAIIDGKVVGDIEAKVVKLNVTSEMIGDVRHEVIEVASGARIEGHYGRIEANSEAKSAAKPANSRNIKSEKEAPPKAPAAGPSKVAAASVPEASEIAGSQLSTKGASAKPN